MKETMERWGEWTSERFRKNKNQLTPKIEHIHDIEWEKEEMRIKGDLQSIRRQAALAMIMQGEPETETCLNQEYAGQEIGRELRNLANRKARGSERIPGEAYEATRKSGIKP